MNKKLFKKTAVLNVILITFVGALHTAAVAAMIYHKPTENPELTADAVNFDVMEMEFFGANNESVAEAMIEDVAPREYHHKVESIALEKEIVAVESADTADVIKPKEVEKPKEPIIEKPVEKPKPVIKKAEVKPQPKPQPKVQTKNVAQQASKQQLKGGKPLVSSSRIKFIKNPAPKRPRIAHRNKWTGSSVVMVEIDQRGNPVKVILERSSGHDVLDKAALEAARGVKIHPYIENGQQIAIRHRMDYAF